MVPCWHDIGPIPEVPRPADPRPAVPSVPASKTYLMDGFFYHPSVVSFMWGPYRYFLSLKIVHRTWSPDPFLSRPSGGA